MLDIQKLRQIEPKVIAVGSYKPILQSMLDFDYIMGKSLPSLLGIVATGRKYERFFWGKKEILIPVFRSAEQVPGEIKEQANFFINTSSGRRTFSSTVEVLESFPNLVGGNLFAEDVPEQQAIALYHKIKNRDMFLVGPASVGILVPRVLKLGAIGGTEAKQLITAHLFESGQVAVFAASGGMVNEIINQVAAHGKRLSFALHFGGDRFPVTTPKEAFLAAENDPETRSIVYYGELGGQDEYELVELLLSKQITKEVIVYVAGTISEIFENPPQFGHAKAMAKNMEETAGAKRKALKEAGAKVAESFGEFIHLISVIPDLIRDPERVSTDFHGIPHQVRNDTKGEMNYNARAMDTEDRKSALIASSISKDQDGKVQLLGEDLLGFAKNHSFAYIVSSLFLGQKIKSKEFEEFVNFVLKLLVDHGPYVSGAVNTIVASRAGKDLVSSLSAGLLTIGPRFGGAINQAASNWLEGVSQNKSAVDFVEKFSARKEYIPGIGHRKYRVDMPDPRVVELLQFADQLTDNKYTTFAREVEKITTAKKGNLILNVDGTIAAVLLDILSEKEDYTLEQLEELVSTEFFNALFVLSRSVGFIAHFLDQKRLDEGIFRLSEEHVADATK